MSLYREPAKRLKDENSALQELGTRSFSKERLEKNQQAIKQAIESLPATSAASPGTKIAGTSIVLGLTVALVWNLSPHNSFEIDDEAKKASQHTSQKAETSSAAIPDSPKEPATARANDLEGEPEKNEYDHRKIAQDMKPSDEEGKFKKRTKAPLRQQPDRAIQSSSKAAPSPTLGREIKQFQKAKNHFENKDYEQSKTVLEELQKAIPNHQLEVEIILLQIQNHLALEEPNRALEMMQTLLTKPSSKPQAQWYKLLGDIHHRLGRCGPAVIAYSKALKMGLGTQQEQLVRRAVRSCSQPQ